jgi:GT2 family glycosyltransferase
MEVGVRVTAAIPTYGRGQVLLDTIHALLGLEVPADEILVVDQTPAHEPAVESELRSLHEEGKIRWLRLAEPSIPKSMNEALRWAAGELVLFLDDDIVPAARVVAAHRAAHDSMDVWAVSGQVLQPGQEEVPAPLRPPKGPWGDLTFPYNQNRGDWVDNVMAGNLSVRREAALRIGGFDENFLGVAYRFETDFARRILAAGGRIWFEPSASIRHLQAPSGGTRSHGSHLTSASAAHSVGDYYFALVTLDKARWRYVIERMLRSVRTRFHATHPWWIPVKLIGELRGLLLALELRRRGRRLAR